MTYTTKQIERAVAAAEGPRTLANSIWRDAFDRDAPAIVRQQMARIEALEAGMEVLRAWLASTPGYWWRQECEHTKVFAICSECNGHGTPGETVATVVHTVTCLRGRTEALLAALIGGDT